jgi:restriction system protein
MFEVRIQHPGLRAFRLVKGETKRDAELKAEAQMAIWNQRWARHLSAEKARAEKLGRWLHREEGREQAIALSTEAASQIARVESLLKTCLIRGKFVDWEWLKDKTPFAEPEVDHPKPKSPPAEPQPSEFALPFSILDKIIPPLKARKLERGEAAYQTAHSSWKATSSAVEDENRKETERTKRLVKEREDRKKQYMAKQSEQHSAVEENRAAFLAENPVAVESFFSDVLTLSEYPDTFPEEARLQYQRDTGTLMVDYELPNMTALPAIKEVKYIAARNALQEVPVSDTWLRKAYDDVLYQIALRTLHELFIHDESEALQGIVFNGWVSSIDKATGAETHACIMSIHVQRQEFLEIRLDQVEPKACFRKLKGVASSKLTELTPIRPVMSLSRDDERFVDPYAVLDGVDDRTNLASMDWLDFENLIREVFEKEFSKNGGAVKITQASRDGGVDAIAFDPDPIRGGKIVIQAKRYTNVVGVAAVRDLYGTVHNEGATKGILVTTSTYGPDAYEFAKGKPLTLLSGSELLYLLGQHGHKSKIDLAAAKIEHKESQRQVTESRAKP